MAWPVDNGVLIAVSMTRADDSQPIIDADIVAAWIDAEGVEVAGSRVDLEWVPARERYEGTLSGSLLTEGEQYKARVWAQNYEFRVSRADTAEERTI